jgi:hypothetical protein
MHRIARDGRNAFRMQDRNIHDGDTVVWCFGEIDVRCHVIRQARLQNTSVDAIVAGSAQTYLRSVDEITREAGRCNTILLAVIPPTNQANNPDFPTVGSLVERIRARVLLNEALEREGAARGFQFLNPYSEFMDPRGALKESMPDSNIHCGPASASIVADQLLQYYQKTLPGPAKGKAAPSSHSRK